MTEAEQPADVPPAGRTIGRFEMFGQIASGGFAAVHIGRTVGAGGFAKCVAIKRLHRQYVEDEEVVRMFLDEARVVARVQHPNVVPTLDFIEEKGELFMVMEYVEGVTLGYLLGEAAKRSQRIPIDISLAILAGTLRGLHAAHEARNERGEALCVIHRDVSPDNILVGTDGFARILDFGVAKALGRVVATRDGHVKGKLSYLTPEQVTGNDLTRGTDVFSAAVVMWECLTNRKLFEAENVAELAVKVSQQPIPSPTTLYPSLPKQYEDVVMRGLARAPADRFQTAEEMAEALEGAGKPASPGRVGRWVKSLAGHVLAERTELLSAVELTPSGRGDTSHVSGGQDAYRAAATQVLKARARAPTVETTKVIITDDRVDPSAAASASQSYDDDDGLDYWENPPLSKPGILRSSPGATSGVGTPPAGHALGLVSAPGLGPSGPERSKAVGPSGPEQSKAVKAADVPADRARDPGTSDAGAKAASAKASPMDASAIDANPIDANPIDANPIDANPIDEGTTVDAGAPPDPEVEVDDYDTDLFRAPLDDEALVQLPEPVPTRKGRNLVLALGLAAAVGAGALVMTRTTPDGSRAPTSPSRALGGDGHEATAPRRPTQAEAPAAQPTTAPEPAAPELPAEPPSASPESEPQVAAASAEPEAPVPPPRYVAARPAPDSQPAKAARPVPRAAPPPRPAPPSRPVTKPEDKLFSRD